MDSTGIRPPEETLEDLYRRNLDWLRRYARAVGHRDPDDAAQDAFAALANRQAKPPRVENPLGYMVTTIQHRRRRRPVPRWLAWASVRPVYDRYEDHDLQTAIETLSQQQQICVALRYALDMTVPAIAETLALSESTVNTHLARALRTLKAQLETNE